MDKREFLKASGAMVAGSMLSRFAKGEMAAPGADAGVRTNWAGNLTYSAARLDEPSSLAEVQQLVKSRTPVKALGARHSFNNIADTTGDQISLVAHLDEMTLDAEKHTVTVGGGVKYGLLAPWLDERGFAVHNLASLPHVTVIGACATATHGSGFRCRLWQKVSRNSIRRAMRLCYFQTRIPPRHAAMQQPPHPKTACDGT